MSQSTMPSQTSGSYSAVGSVSQTSGGASSIPDLLKIGAMPSNTAIEVETSILEPVTHSDTHCKFVLQNKGILHSHSKLEFEYKVPQGAAGVSDGSMLPVGVGIHSLIQRATLRVGAKTICEVDDYNQMSCFHSQFLSPETELEREQYMGGRKANSMGFNYTNQTIAGGAEYAFGSDKQSNTDAKDLMLDNGIEQDLGGASDPGVLRADVRVHPQEMLSRVSGDGAAAQVLTVRQDLAPKWQIAISDLFPFLKTNQLPIYMFKEPINLELVFSESGSKAGTVSQRSVAQANPAACSVLTSATRLVADYLYYPQEMMASFAAANRSMSFQYVDYRLSKFSVSQASLGSTDIRNVGGAGRIVSKVIFGLQDTTRGVPTIPVGQYLAEAPGRTYGGAGSGATDTNGDATFNVKYNEQFLFPIDVSNSARHYHNLVQTQGQVPFTTREVYSNQGVSLSKLTFHDFAGQFQANFKGSQFWQALRLNRGERVNSRGIELYFKMEEMPAHGFVQRCWLETLRVAELKDGILECYYA